MSVQNQIPIGSEKRYRFEGYFDINHTFHFVKDFLEKSRHYDVTEKDYDEKNINGTKKLLSLNEAEQEYNDYYKVLIKFEFLMEGIDEEVKINGKLKTLTKGKASLIVNGYIVPDHLGKREKGALFTFLEKIYDKYIGKDELDKCIMSGVIDINETMSRFKQAVNASTK